ncbi:hypothetical protein ACFX2A_009375 [Malus domestica]
MAEVSSRQPSWEVELDVLIASFSGMAGPSAAMLGSTETNAITKLQELLSFSASQILECKGFDSMRECLNDFAADGCLSNEVVTRVSSILE